MKRWRISEADKPRAKQIASELELDEFLVLLLVVRGYTTSESVRAFLEEEASLSDPFILKDMDKAVARLKTALDEFQMIAVFGDYDADGITATTLVYSYLETLGANVMFYIPEREDGYGMSKCALLKLSECGVELIVTVDNGIAAIDEIAYARSLHMDVVVTDHHQPSDVLPEACAVVDPHRKDCPSLFKDFAGVGVALKLICALEGEDGNVDAVLDNFSELVAIGTIADIVPLKGENRMLVKRGLRQMVHTDRLGLRALMEEAGLDMKHVTSGNVSFGLAPRINATGRMGSPARSVKLLLSEEPEEAGALSLELCDENRNRQAAEQDIHEKINAYMEAHPERLYDRVLVVDGEGFHAGVIGIVAARLLEKYGKPVVVIARSGESAQGSGRSLPGFSLYEALTACAPLLEKYGGHEMAGGMSLRSENTEAFRARINDYAARCDMPVAEIFIDLKLNPAGLSTELVAQMSEMEPFGCGNDAPLFALLGMTLTKIHPVGGGKHLRLTAAREGAEVTIMRFGVRAEQFPYRTGDLLDFTVTLDATVFRDQEQLSVYAKDIRPSGLDVEDYIAQQRLYEQFCREEPLSGEEARRLMPTREDNGTIYRFLREQKGWTHGTDILCHRLKAYNIGYGRLCVALDAMEEKGLLVRERNGGTEHIVLQPVTGKVDLESGERYRRLMHFAG